MDVDWSIVNRAKNLAEDQLDQPILSFPIVNDYRQPLASFMKPGMKLLDIGGNQRTLLGEDLVLFRDKSGRLGLLADRCSHRGVSLVYGRVEERGIACAYHGWLYDTMGNCLDCPRLSRRRANFT